MSVKHVVAIYLDWEVEGMPLSREWVRDRMPLFSETTLKSLLNQSFNDFEIHLLCGSKYRKLTERFPWNSQIHLVYDKGRSFLQELDTDYLAITRIDSDDLFHKDAMQEVSEEVILSNKMEFLIFRKNLLWDRITGMIGRHIATSPPFFTHIYPKALYKDWDYFHATHLVDHGKAGGRRSGTKELGVNRVCVVKHSENISIVRQQVERTPVTGQRLEKYKRQGKFVTDDLLEMRKILADFAVEAKDV